VNRIVEPVPVPIVDRYGLDTAYYARCIVVDGIPVLGSRRTGDTALDRAAAVVGTLNRARGIDVPGALSARRVRVAIVGAGETLRALPEVRAAFGDDLDGVDRRYWGGFGATHALPLCVGTEANLVGGEGGENVFVHEYAHTVMDLGLRVRDPRVLRALDDAYEDAKRRGLWPRTYAISNRSEYWAEGVQSYFDVNRAGPTGGDGVHNDIATKARLAAYDPPLFRLIDRFYRGARL
jgi:hypothetical protein